MLKQRVFGVRSEQTDAFRQSSGRKADAEHFLLTDKEEGLYLATQHRADGGFRIRSRNFGSGGTWAYVLSCQRTRFFGLLMFALPLRVGAVMMVEHNLFKRCT